MGIIFIGESLIEVVTKLVSSKTNPTYFWPQNPLHFYPAYWLSKYNFIWPSQLLCNREGQVQSSLLYCEETSFILGPASTKFSFLSISDWHNNSIYAASDVVQRAFMCLAHSCSTPKSKCFVILPAQEGPLAIASLCLESENSMSVDNFWVLIRIWRSLFS